MGQILPLESGTSHRQEFKSGEVVGLEAAEKKINFFLNRTSLSDLKIRDNPEVNIRYNLGAPNDKIRLA
jgi:hypothetical protein